MSNLLVSFDQYQNDWYVGELYKSFIEYLKNKNISINYINIKELSNQYNHNYSIDSIFSIYNLIITNIDTKKTFIHSLYDGAPAMMDRYSGIENFDIAAFSCCSNLTPEIYDKYSTKYTIFPSFYILENFSDINYIEQYYQEKKTKNKQLKCYFNGLCYGHRGIFKQALKNNKYFCFKDKSEPSSFQQKIDYYNELSNCKFGLSLNGAAQICYRDVEYFGLGILCLREKLNILTDSPLIQNTHYINLIDDEINKLLYNHNWIELNNALNNKIKKYIINDLYAEDIINNAKNWYNNNIKLESQHKILYKFLEKSGVL